jgi:HSP20 family protein
MKLGKEINAMTLFRFSSDPVESLLSLQRELARVFESPFGFELGPSGRGVYPAMNVFTEKSGTVLRMEVPGVPPENIQIETHGRTLTVSGKREVKAPENGSFHRRERSVGEFSRSVQLPADVDVARAEAGYKHGILTIRVPKKEEAKPRQIAVQAA